MAFILGVGRKTARQPHGRFAANFWVFIQPWGIRNDLESVRKFFSFGKFRNFEKNITWDYSRAYQFPVPTSRPEVENMTMHSFRVNSIYPQSFIQIGPRVSEITLPTPKMNAVSANIENWLWQRNSMERRSTWCWSKSSVFRVAKIEFEVWKASTDRRNPHAHTDKSIRCRRRAY